MYLNHLLMQQAKRCRATSKRSGKPCQAPAVKDWDVCRFHGAKGGRPPSHGLYTKKSIAERKAISLLMSELTLIQRLFN
jgi:hypothetical protein